MKHIGWVLCLSGLSLSQKKSTQFGLSRGHLNTGFQARHREPRISRDEIPSVGIGSLWVRIKAAGHNANDNLAPACRPTRQFLADHLRIAGENALPHGVADHNCLSGVSLDHDFVSSKPSPEKRLRSQHIE